VLWVFWGGWGGVGGVFLVVGWGVLGVVWCCCERDTSKLLGPAAALMDGVSTNIIESVANDIVFSERLAEVRLFD